MSRMINSFSLSLFLSISSLTACSDENVYEAPMPIDKDVIAVTDGDPASGWFLNGIKDGSYDLEFYTKSAQSEAMPYIVVNDKMTTITPSPSTWSKNIVKGITVTDGKCTIVLKNGNDVEISNLKLISNQKGFELIKGADIAELGYVEDNGGKYYHSNGDADDCLEILKQNGVNLVRLRLYNDPGNKDFSPSKDLPAGYQDESDVLRLAKRAKDKGFQIQLTFHYSDSWTNGEEQNKPHEWASLDYEGLKNAVYTYTSDFLRKMNEQGTTPEYVSLGNEIQAGLLYPDGACKNPVQMCELLNSGAKAVREVSPDSRIVIHSACQDISTAETTLKWYFGLMRDYNVDYDIMGLSMYPFYTNMSATQMRMLSDKMVDCFDKDIMYMETAVAWNPTLPDGYPGQIAHNGPYEEMSKLGQRDFISDLSNQIKLVKDGRVLGYIYWDPIFIAVPGLGYILGERNVVSNTTLFGFQGEWLPVFDAIKNNN